MTIAENLARVHENIANACARSNRGENAVTLVAVSKTMPIMSILSAIEAGQQHFGENRVEEGIEKIPEINKQTSCDTTWHMIGHIQSRKAKSIIPLFDLIHSVDSVKLAEKLSRLAQDEGKTLDILLEVNVSGEDAKYGFGGTDWYKDTQVKDQLWQEIKSIIELPNLNVNGLMTMAPFVDDMDIIRPVFRDLARLRDELSEAFGLPMPELSMGMTNDYEVAIEEGATIVRVGRAIFGER